MESVFPPHPPVRSLKQNDKELESDSATQTFSQHKPQPLLFSSARTCRGGAHAQGAISEPPK